jgi:Ni/Fe-hydrogenase b-type cytochrome subunit
MPDDPFSVTDSTQSGSQMPDSEPLSAPLVLRHRWPIRAWHWLNAICLLVLFMSGLGIFNAHPRLYWGQFGANFDPAWLELERFPGWLTLPSYYSLALARRWHLAFAPIFAFALLAYLIWLFAGRRLFRDLRLRRQELAPAHLWQDIKAHARLKFPTGDAALHYNVLQKLSYVAVLCGLLPLLILSGLAMSPGINAAAPWIVDLLGGRQSARSIHFLCAWAVAGFFVVHILMVILAGPLNELRSIVTGWYRLPQEKRP